MEFRILGPLRVHRAGAAVAISGRHHPKALAMLVEEANRVVPVDRLTGALWEGPFPTRPNSRSRTWSAACAAASDPTARG